MWSASTTLCIFALNMLDYKKIRSIQGGGDPPF
jgi:hypothetical protein